MYDPKKVPPHTGYYLAGFADGEGSFNIAFRKRNDYANKWKISACFNVSQKDPVILSLFKKHLKCGTMRQRQDGIWYFEVNNLNAICENLIPFFDHFGFLSAKKKNDFSKFKKIVYLIKEGKHLTEEGMKEIFRLREKMNSGGKRKYSENEIFKESEILRDYTPDTSSSVKI